MRTFWDIVSGKRLLAFLSKKNLNWQAGFLLACLALLPAAFAWYMFDSRFHPTYNAAPKPRGLPGYQVAMPVEDRHAWGTVASIGAVVLLVAGGVYLFRPYRGDRVEAVLSYVDLLESGDDGDRRLAAERLVALLPTLTDADLARLEQAPHDRLFAPLSMVNPHPYAYVLIAFVQLAVRIGGSEALEGLKRLDFKISPEAKYAPLKQAVEHARELVAERLDRERAASTLLHTVSYDAPEAESLLRPANGGAADEQVLLRPDVDA